MRDAEGTIGGALADASEFCDDLVVVDTGSLDDTVTVAKSFGARVFHFDWIDDFAAARNFALDQTSGQWSFILDADDRIPQGAWSGLHVVLAELPDLAGVDAIRLPYHYLFSELSPDVCIYRDQHIRLIRNGSDAHWIGRVHEHVQCNSMKDLSWKDAEVWVEHRHAGGHLAESLARNLRILEQSAAEGDRSFRTLYYLAMTLSALHRDEEALQVLEEIFTGSLSEPLYLGDRYRVHLALARVTSSLGLVERKLELLGSAIALDSERAEAFIELGMHFYEQQEWTRAMPFFAAATVLHTPELGEFNPGFYSWLPWDFLAICSSETGDFKFALDCWLRALPGNPDRERILTNLRICAGQL